MARIFRILLPAIVVLIVVGVWVKFLWTPVWVRSWKNVNSAKAVDTYWLRGWPIAYQRGNWTYDLRGDVTSTGADETFSPWGLLADLVLALTTTAVVSVLLLRRIKSEKRYSFSLRTFLLAVLLVGACVGWSMREFQQIRRDERIVIGLSTSNCSIESAAKYYWGPDWLHRLCTPRISSPGIGPTLRIATAWFDRPVVDLAGIDSFTSPRGPLSAETLRTILNSLAELPNLRSIELTPRIGDLSAEILRPIGKCSKLVKLDLSENGVDVQALAAIDPLPELESLDLSVCPNIDDDAIGAIGRHPSLTSLYLRGTQLTDDGAKRLVHLNNLKRLTLPFRISNDVANSLSAKGVTVE